MRAGRLERLRRPVPGWLADSLVAGVVVTLFELHQVLTWWPGAWSIGRLAGVVWLVLGLMGLGAVIAGPTVLLLATLALRLKPLSAWWTDLAAGGEARVAALVRATVAVAALLLFAAFAYVLAAWANRTFLEARPIALLEATLLSVFVAIAGLAAVEVSIRLAPRASRSARLVAWSNGRVGLTVAVAVFPAAALGIPLVAHWAAPDGDLERPTTTFCWFLLTLAVMRFARQRVSFRLVRPVVTIAALSVVTVPLTTGWTEAGRHAVWSSGATSRLVGVSVLRAFDRDRDGFASELVGGADCDDGDPRIGPGVAEVAGNGQDDNCSGGDLSPRALASRLTARPASVSVGHMNVLLVTIDAVRADHLGAWGYARSTSPRLDALAARSTRFAWALTTTPTTRWALRAISLGRYSSSFGWTDDGKTARAGKAPALGASLAAAGYDTRSIMCCPWPPEVADAVHAGMAQVDQPAASPREKSKRLVGRRVAAEVVQFLSARPRGATRPFFVWTHLIDPHNPYERPAGAPDFGSEPLDRYDSEIAYADSCLGEILDGLDRSGLAATTIVAVASDHGEEFSDHGRSFHGSNLYNETLRVPLIIHLPGAPARVVDTPVSLADLSPTLADLAGVSSPAGQNGRSLADAVRGTGDAPARPVLAEVIPDHKTNRNLLAMMTGCYKLIWDRESNTFELYSRCDDPGDRNDRATSEPELLQRMRRLMAAQVDIDLAAVPVRVGAGDR